MFALIATSSLTFSSCGGDDDDDELQKQKTDANGFECVDLGLSVKWALCNVGAQSPEEPGLLFAWGEVKPKEIFKRDDYKHSEKSHNSETNRYDHLYTKYCTNSNYGINDGIKTLQEEDDAAHVNMGGTWRMPTNTELAELMQNCKREYVTVNGSFCVKFTGPNGNYILLPGLTRAEYSWDSQNHRYTDYHIRTESPKTGGIWTSTLCVSYEQAQTNGYCLRFHDAWPSLSIEPGTSMRWDGMAIRGVLE